VTRCREQLEAFRTAGVDIPILMPPMGVDAARKVIEAFPALGVAYPRPLEMLDKVTSLFADPHAKALL